MGMPAARRTDNHYCPAFLPNGSPHQGGPIAGPCAPKVLIYGLPAARLNDKAVCKGPIDTIVAGCPTVLIYGLPAARQGDACGHGGYIERGCPKVLIG